MSMANGLKEIFKSADATHIYSKTAKALIPLDITFIRHLEDHSEDLGLNEDDVLAKAEALFTNKELMINTSILDEIKGSMSTYYDLEFSYDTTRKVIDDFLLGSVYFFTRQFVDEFVNSATYQNTLVAEKVEKGRLDGIKDDIDNHEYVGCKFFLKESFFAFMLGLFLCISEVQVKGFTFVAAVCLCICLFWILCAVKFFCKTRKDFNSLISKQEDMINDFNSKYYTRIVDVLQAEVDL